jgi:hypothetical protein
VWIGLAATLIGGALFYADKASEDRSAILRWLFQVAELRDGVNIWDRYVFPNPPIFPIFLMPLTYLEPMAAALIWYGFKCLLGILTILMCFRMVRQPGDKVPMPAWLMFAILVLSLRPILSDLHHANNNLVILFLVVAALWAWRKQYDVAAGLSLALAITFKVTPGLFLVYFLWKRSWRTAGATVLGMGLFLLAVPSLVLGVQFNGVCLGSWFHRMLRPFVVNNHIGDDIINQSMGGVLMRFFTEQPEGPVGRYIPMAGLELAALDPVLVARVVKVLSILVVVGLGFLCRTRATRRDDPRLLGEFSLVVLVMLIVSERSWKHHFVTLLLPYTYLCYQLWRVKLSRLEWGTIATGLAASALLMLSTSSEVGGQFMGGHGHKYAQFYGMFFWSGVVLAGLTGWRVWADRKAPTEESTRHTPTPHILLRPAEAQAPENRPIRSIR